MSARPMTGHLSEQELSDFVSCEPAGEADVHLRACASCLESLQRAREGLDVARMAGLPEPPPEYWPAFRSELRSRIDAADRRRRRMLAPALAAAAALVAALAVLTPRAPVAPEPAATLPAWTPLPPAEADAGLWALEGLVALADDPGPAASCRDFSDCLASLSDEETEALADALRPGLQGEGP